MLHPWILLGSLGVSSNWRDYVSLALLVTLGPLAVWGVRKLCRMIPESMPRQEARPRKSHAGKPPPSQPEYRIVEIATFMNDFQADTACAILKGSGIPAYVRRDDCGGMRPWLRVATGGLRLAVRDVDAQSAASLLREAMQ